MQWEYTGLENERIDNLRRDNPPVDWQDQCKHNSEQKQWYNAETCIQCILSIEQQLAWILSRGIKWECSVQPVVALAGAMALVTPVCWWIYSCVRIWVSNCWVAKSQRNKYRCSPVTLSVLALCVCRWRTRTSLCVSHRRSKTLHPFPHNLYSLSHTRTVTYVFMKGCLMCSLTGFHFTHFSL